MLRDAMGSLVDLCSTNDPIEIEVFLAERPRVACDPTVGLQTIRKTDVQPQAASRRSDWAMQ